MRKVTFFLIVLFSSVFLLVALLIAGFMLTPPTSTPNQMGWVNNMWTCMGDWMSGTYPINDPVLAIYGILLIVAVGVVVLGAAGLTYFYFFPEIRNAPQPVQPINIQPTEAGSAFESVLKTLNEEERKVINVLKQHNGKYLQKYVRQEAGLSRLKTHRILARFAERGIVTLEKTGNTNQVTLAEWLK